MVHGMCCTTSATCRNCLNLISSQHFIANRAIVLGNGEPELVIAYSPGFTALSIFLPMIVLLIAFLALGTNNKVSWWRIVAGGTLTAGGICGMHYIGDYSISNYVCVYSHDHVAGSVLIAVAATIVALALFFVYRAAWTTSWWRRVLCAIVLAGAVSGMHYVASTGTEYRLIRLNASNQLSRNNTVTVIICFSIAASLLLVGTAAYAAHLRKSYADKAQHVVLAAAVFDPVGRILVSPDGLLPSEKITDTYVEKTPDDHFSIAHPLFHWMFQASRNWGGMSNVIHSMANHLAYLRQSSRDARIRLIDDHGRLIENYDVIIRELFCQAASNLADKMKEPITNVGVLWDDILPTGASLAGSKRTQSDLSREMMEKDARGPSPTLGGDADILAETGQGWWARQQEYSRGSLMFLVRRLESSRDVERLQAAGFRFAQVNQVATIIGNSMQIKSRHLSSQLENMATYAEQSMMMKPGVHLGFFGLRARVDGKPFDVLVRRGARNLLPCVQMPFDHLESWQTDFLQQFERMSVPSICQKLNTMQQQLPSGTVFATQLYDTIETLRAWVDDPVFDEAVLLPKLVQVPCQPRRDSSSSTVSNSSTCTMIALKMMIPIHVNVVSPNCEFVPINFLRVHQMVYKDSPHHVAFSRSVHREIVPVVNTAPVATPSPTHQRGRQMILGLGRPKAGAGTVDAEGNPIPTDLERKSSSGSNQSRSTLMLWNGPSSDTPSSDSFSDRLPAPRPPAQTLGGIMISQEIKVDVGAAGDGRYSERSQPDSGSNPGRAGSDRSTTNAGHRRANSAAVTNLKPVPEDTDNVHSGSTIRSAVVESGRAGEVHTFVDELLALSTESR